MRRVSRLPITLVLLLTAFLTAQNAIASARVQARRPSQPPLLKRLILVIRDILEVPKP